MRRIDSSWLQRVIAAAVLIALAIPYLASGYWKVYGSLFLSYPLLAACGAFIYMAILGVGGPVRNYGISGLFLSDRWWRQLVAGLGTVLFFIEVFALCYYFDLNRGQTNRLTLRFIDSIPVEAAHRWAEPLRRHDPAAGRGGRPDAKQFADINNRRIRAFLYVAGLPILVTLILPAMLPGLRASVPDASRRGVRRIAPCWVLGIALGVLLVWLLNLTMLDHRAVGWLARHTPLRWVVDWMRIRLPDRSLGMGRGPASDDFLEPLQRDYCISIVNTICQTAFFFALSMACYRKGPPARGVTPAFAICMLLGFVAGVYATIAFFSQGYQLLFYLLLLGLLALTNSGNYKLRLPGLETYYGRPFRRNTVNLDRYDLGHATPRHAGKDAVGERLDSESILNAWRDGILGPRTGSGSAGAPKLVVVAVTGGAIRSATWVAVVLSELEKELAARGKELDLDGGKVPFSRHVRLITGASGGMVGAAYYLTALANGRSVDGLAASVTSDALTPVAARLASRDIPSIFSPFDQQYDRGLALEDAWDLRSQQSGSPITFDDLRPLEMCGRLPSAVFSPILIEDGRRLLISNLELDGLTRSEGNVLLDADARDLYGRIYSKSAVEFFRLFPQARGFRLSTAARMNATFPYISPMLSLPTAPPRRVADAGYYDNYGVNLATAWIDRHRQWLADHTSGVLLVQLRDGLSEQARHELVLPGRFAPSRSTSLQFALSPLQALFAAWRSMSSYRNDEQVQSTSDWFDRHVHEGFFTTVVFESPAQVPMSWTMTTAEKEDLMAGMGENTGTDRRIADRVAPEDRKYVRANIRRLEALMNWWGKDGRPVDEL